MMKHKKTIFSSILSITVISFLSVFFIQGCGKKEKPAAKFDTQPISIKQFDTPQGADPNVPAEQGGNGFTGEGWTTNTDYNYLGDENAVKGGSISWAIESFPPSLRLFGKDENSYYTRLMQNMVYESLLDTDPVNENEIPQLATHWQKSENNTVYRFRINPNARWADGKPVTTEDVIATWKLAIDPGLLSGVGDLYQTYLETPVAESKYIVRYKAKKEGWLPFSIAASIRILPAHVIGGVSGKDYLDKFNYDVVPGSGPYYIRQDDIQKGQSITMRRRSDYWGEKERWNIGMNNFDAFRTDVIADERLRLEKVKKGETDIYSYNRAQWWADESNFDEVKRGLVMKKRIFNQNPAGLQGLAFNMRKAPFNDIKVRKAFQMLYDIDKFNEKLFYNAYKPTKSQFAATVYENPNNPRIKYNLDSAMLLLDEAGWSQRNGEGYRVKDGKVFSVDLSFTQAGQERYLTIFQEDLKKAGVKLNLKQVDPTTNFKIGNQRNFELIMVAWAGQTPPNHEFNLTSKMADDTNSTNWSGFKSPRVDELVTQYNIEEDKAKRVQITREIDSIMYAELPYVYGWFADYTRLIWLNKFGFPPYIVCRFDDYYSSTEPSIFQMWWTDPERLAAYNEALKGGTITLDEADKVVDNNFWLDVAARENKGETVKIPNK